MEKYTKIINGKETKYVDIICHTIETRLTIWEKIKILFGKPVISESKLYTGTKVKLAGVEAIAYVPPLIVRKSKGMMEMNKPEVDKKEL